jgi:hypothetical protein
MGLSDLFGQFLDIAAGQFGVDARLPGILQLDLDSLKVDHTVPLSRSLNPSRTAKINTIRFVLQLFLLLPRVRGIVFNKWG